ncbi:MAG: hypothetical protein HY269_07205 [Deltaproteobacteria bacterium]|nr:hypothetical protein [Deltaproteobacteria bacterium]
MRRGVLATALGAIVVVIFSLAARTSAGAQTSTIVPKRLTAKRIATVNLSEAASHSILL